MTDAKAKALVLQNCAAIWAEAARVHRDKSEQATGHLTPYNHRRDAVACQVLAHDYHQAVAALLETAVRESS